MELKKKSGRPKKAEGDKVKYQRIAVYSEDYLKLNTELQKRNIKLTDAFTSMVAEYTR